MSKRRQPSLETKLAAALLTLGDVPYEHAKQMSARQICSLYHFDHYPIRKADGGKDEPWNLQPLLISAHREKTATKDKPELAKQARLRGETGNRPKKKIPSQPFPKGRGFERRP